MVRGHSLITYAKKSNLLTLPPCEFATVYFGKYSLPSHKCIHKMIHCTPLFFIFASETDSKDWTWAIWLLWTMYRDILKTTSRRQLVHISNRTTKPVVYRYCSRLRRFYVVILMNSGDKFKSRQNISTLQK